MRFAPCIPAGFSEGRRRGLRRQGFPSREGLRANRPVSNRSRIPSSLSRGKPEPDPGQAHGGGFFLKDDVGVAVGAKFTGAQQPKLHRQADPSH
jgi:hypothetical protein